MLLLGTNTQWENSVYTLHVKSKYYINYVVITCFVITRDFILHNY